MNLSHEEKQEIRHRCEVLLAQTERLEEEAATARRESETLYNQIVFLESRMERCKHRRQRDEVKEKEAKRRPPGKKRKTVQTASREDKEEHKELLEKFGPIYARRYLTLKTSLNL